MTRSYGQLCGLALALDAIGDRWSLLIVRELLVRPDGARYTDLRDGLPGIATNLLADRLRTLEMSGTLRRDEPRPPVATPVFRLTDRGRGLAPAVEALALWGGAFVPATDPAADFRSRWLAIPVQGLLRDRRPSEPAVRLRIDTGDEPVSVLIADGEVRVGTEDPAGPPDLVVTGPPKAVLGLLAGKVPVVAAATAGIALTGDVDVLDRAGIGPVTVRE